jgi:hypothetical protein
MYGWYSSVGSTVIGTNPFANLSLTCVRNSPHIFVQFVSILNPEGEKLLKTSKMADFCQSLKLRHPIGRKLDSHIASYKHFLLKTRKTVESQLKYMERMLLKRVAVHVLLKAYRNPLFLTLLDGLFKKQKFVPIQCFVTPSVVDPDSIGSLDLYKAASISSAPLHPRIFFRFVTSYNSPVRESL